KRIGQTDAGELRVAGQLGEHAPRDLFALRQGDAMLLARAVGVAAVPFLRSPLGADGPRCVLRHALTIRRAIRAVAQAVFDDQRLIEAGHTYGSSLNSQR